MEEVICECGFRLSLNYERGILSETTLGIKFWTFTCGICGQQYHKKAKDPIELK